MVVAGYILHDIVQMLFDAISNHGGIAPAEGLVLPSFASFIKAVGNSLKKMVADLLAQKIMSKFLNIFAATLW